MKNIFKPGNQVVRINRRELLALGATGAVALAGFHSRGGAAVYAANSTQTTPDVTEGPYWVDEQLKRSDIRVDPSDNSVQVGLPLFLNISVSQLSNSTVSPLANAYVDLWHANALGVYSDEAANNNSTAESTSGQKWLRGYQITDTNGHVNFLTIYPSWYVSRTIHIHARVRVYPDNDPTQTASYNFTTQFFFDDDISDKVINSLSPYNTRTSRDTRNSTDSVFTGASADSASGVTSESGDYLLLRLADDLSHAVASFHMILDLSSTISGGSSTSSTGGSTSGGPPSTGGGPPSTGGGPGGG